MEGSLGENICIKKTQDYLDKLALNTTDLEWLEKLYLAVIKKWASNKFKSI